MKVFKPKGLDPLLERRRKLLLQYEVVAYEIAETNKAIGELFYERLSNKSILFNDGNTVAYTDEDGQEKIGMPSNKPYTIEQILSANTFDDIVYMVRENGYGKAIAIRQEEFRSFKFNIDETDD